MKERDSSGTALRRGAIKVLHPPEDLYASMTKRRAEHPVTGQENGLEIARDESIGGWVIQKPSVLNAHGCSPIHFYRHNVTRIGQIIDPKLEIREKLETQTNPNEDIYRKSHLAYWTLGQYVQSIDWKIFWEVR